MGTAANFVVHYQGRHLLLRTSMDGQVDNVLPKVVESAAVYGLDALRVAFAQTEMISADAAAEQQRETNRRGLVLDALPGALVQARQVAQSRGHDVPWADPSQEPAEDRELRSAVVELHLACAHPELNDMLAHRPADLGEADTRALRQAVTLIDEGEPVQGVVGRPSPQLRQAVEQQVERQRGQNILAALPSPSASLESEFALPYMGLTVLFCKTYVIEEGWGSFEDADYTLNLDLGSFFIRSDKGQTLCLPLRSVESADPTQVRISMQRLARQLPVHSDPNLAQARLNQWAAHSSEPETAPRLTRRKPR